MDSKIIDHLEKIHESGKKDFRWENLRKLVKRYVIGECVLDAGCGTGHMTLGLCNEGYKVTAIDCSEKLTFFTKKILKKNNQKADVYTMNLLEVNSLGENRYDTILCLDVLEHIEDDQLALSNLAYTLKNEANLIISVPALGILYGQRDREIGHYRRYNKVDLIRLIENSGLDITEIRFWNFLGLIPVFISEKVLHKKINEGFRYNNKSPLSLQLLNRWFSIIENNMQFPIGLSLIAVCKKREEKL